MFTSEDVRGRIKKQPFEPLRIIMSAGDHYDLCHPELAVVGKLHVFVGTASADNPIEFDRSSLLSLLHIAAIETLPSQGAVQKNGQ